MTSLFTNLFSAFPTADGGGLFSSLNAAKGTLNGPLLQDVANFTGAIAILAGVVFLVVAVVKTRDKIRWFWMSGGAFLIGAMLILGAAKLIQSNAGNTWQEVFGGSVGSSTSLLFHTFFNF